MRFALPLLAAIVVLVGCGSADRDPNLAQAATKTEDTGSSRIEISGTESEDGKPVEIDCAGEASYDMKRLRMSCDYGGKSGMEIVDVGRDTYVRGDIFGVGAGSDKWLKVTDEGFADLFSPQGLLTMLRGASQQTERVGEDEIRGAETVRYRLEVDCGQVELFDCEGETEEVDVWIDDDGLVRRIEVATGSSPFSVEFFDFGVDIDIVAPSPDQVVDIDEWSAPKPCRPGEASPLTGADVTDALRRQGLEVGADDECYGDVVAVLSGRTPGDDPQAFVHCLVHRAPGSDSIGLELEGMQSETIANVRCSSFKDGMGTIERIAAALERQIRK